jgi:hypothetical protein
LHGASAQEAEVVSLRLDARRRRGIARIARARRVTPSEVMRSALDALLDRESGVVAPYEGWSRVLGVVKDAPADLSEHTGRRFAVMLRRRK